MKKLILVGLTLTLSVIIFSFTKKGTEGIFEFETELIDYGTIPQNSDGYRTFTFTNKGVNPIIIEKVKLRFSYLVSISYWA